MSERAPVDPGVRLMLAFQAGDESAFDQLVERYSGTIFGLLTRFLGPVSVREDLVQEVFLRVLRARERYRPSARLSTWLYRIAFNLCVNERARQRVDVGTGRSDESPETHAEASDEGTLEPWETLERADLVRQVRDAIAALPERQRMALILARYEELPYTEIGDVLGVSDRAIKSLVHRARESLRERLAALLPEESP